MPSAAVCPSLVIVAALAENRVIGRDGQLPWRLPDDLKRFKALTLGHTVLMGRKTRDSLGKPLPGRDNWVLSRDETFAPEGARAFQSLDAALAAHARAQPEAPLFVIGGGELYRQTLPLAERLELTEVHTSVEGDAWFPEFDPAEWREAESTVHAADERHALAFRFVTLVRRA